MKDDSLRAMAPSSPSSPAWLAVSAAMSLAVVVTVVVLSSTKVLAGGADTGTNDGSGPKVVSGVVTKPTPPVDTGAVPPWVASLMNTTCEGSCVGGSACKETGNKPCPSRYTCILGEKGDLLDEAMPLNLHLSAILGGDAAGLCSTNTVVCPTPASTQTESCIPMTDVCAHSGRATIAVPLVVGDLVSGGVDVRVRQDGNAIPIRATGKIRYESPIQKVGMCTGFKVGGLTNAPGSDIRYVTFFVEPRLP